MSIFEYVLALPKSAIYFIMTNNISFQQKQVSATLYDLVDSIQSAKALSSGTYGDTINFLVIYPLIR